MAQLADAIHYAHHVAPPQPPGERRGPAGGQALHPVFVMPLEAGDAREAVRAVGGGREMHLHLMAEGASSWV